MNSSQAEHPDNNMMHIKILHALRALHRTGKNEEIMLQQNDILDLYFALILNYNHEKITSDM